MAELSRSSKYRATPGAPLTDDERNRLVERLNAAYADGGVGEADYHVLLDTAFRATTLGEVAEVVETLPPEPTHAVPAIVAVGDGRPGEVSAARAPSASTVAAWVAGGSVALVVLITVLAAVFFLL